MLQIQNMFTYDDSKSRLPWSGLTEHSSGVGADTPKETLQQSQESLKNSDATRTRCSSDREEEYKKKEKDVQIAAAANETFLHTKNFKKQIDNMHLWKFTTANI